jgi:phospholipid/cholesterol/gamma-HCH transport system substrate-binding protein
MNRILRIGIFTAVGIFAIIAFSVYVNDHPYWYRACNEVKIYVDDATGLRRKSPVKTLGLEIGFINAVDLEGDKVLIKVCVTGPVKLTPDTRAKVRSSGFLGDMFLELRPMAKIGGVPPSSGTPVPSEPSEAPPAGPSSRSDMPGSPHAVNLLTRALVAAADWLIPSAYAETTLNATREAELKDTMTKVGKLVDQLTLMVGDLREVTAQKEFKETVVNLSGAMKHLEGLLRPDGKVMKDVSAAMTSMRNTMADAEAVMNKIKEGEGSIGKFINDPSLYDDIRAAIQSVNLLLGKAGLLRTYVDLGAWRVPMYDGSKAHFMLTIAPNPTRYYLVGITTDPRGNNARTTTTTTVNGGSPTVIVEDKNTQSALLITAMFGKYFGPLDLSVGLQENNGAVGIGYWFDASRRYGIHVDVYSRPQSKPPTERVYARAAIYSSLYVTGGIDQWDNYTGLVKGQIKSGKAYFFGAGFAFDDDDLKYLLAFR